MSLQDELSALKDKLEQKEAEVKRLHEKLVCKLKGEGIEILDRGKTSKALSPCPPQLPHLGSCFLEEEIADKSLNFPELCFDVYLLKYI